MKVLSKLISPIARRLGFVHTSQVVTQLAKRDFQMAQLTRLTNDWASQSYSADSDARTDLSVIRARSRNLCKDNCYAKHFQAMARGNVLGSEGMCMRPKALFANGSVDTKARKWISDRWEEWGRRGNCTVDKSYSWQGVERMAMDSVARDGELVIRKIYGYKGNKFGFAIQLVESDLLDLDWNRTWQGGTQIRMGVEQDFFGAPVAYWLRTQHPNDLFFTAPVGNYRVRVPADQIIHPYMRDRIGQSRGIPWFHAAGMRLKMLGGYEEAEVIAARLGACKMGFFKTSGDAEYSGKETPQGRVMEAEPGSFEQLEQGLEFQSVDWQHPNSQFGAFTKQVLRGVAAGLGVSYNTLANDLEGVNFSSSRVGLMDERSNWMMIQDWFAEEIGNPVFIAFLESQLMMPGCPYSLEDLDRLSVVKWHGRRWTWVDPVKEVAAKVQELGAGLTSISRILAEQNMDRDELFDQIEEDIEAARERGLNFIGLLQSEASGGELTGTPPQDDETDPPEEDDADSKDANTD